MYERLNDIIQTREEGRSRFALMFVDIDNFRWLNETLGHNYGDEVLSRFGTIIKEKLPNDMSVFLAKALSLADKVVLADIYASRETDTLGISSKNLLEELTSLGCECYYFPSFDEIENFLLQNCINGDLLITMGAGDIVKVGEKLLGM